MLQVSEIRYRDFETWDKGNLDLSVDKTSEMLPYEYARSALLLGLKIEQQTGVNPYRYGMIGSSDAHTALAAAGEDNFFSKLPNVEPSPRRATSPLLTFGDKAYMGWEIAASGYAAVWAIENTRASIFDAMRRKEVYATTGPRMIVRFFGGWDFDARDARSRRLARTGYARGIPMGGTLGAAPAGRRPFSSPRSRIRSAPTSTVTRS